MGKNSIYFDVAVIGGGAAGIISAIALCKACKNEISVAIIEKQPRIGKKLLATGNGRCNLSNTNMSLEYYNGSCAEYAFSLISNYNSEYITKYFYKLGLLTTTDECGRIYPYSNSANSVLDILRMNLQKYNITEFCETTVTDIKENNLEHIIETNTERINCRYVVIAGGGKSQDKLGSDGSMLKILEKNNIKINRLYPSLAPIKVKSTYLKALKGIRANGAIRATIDGKEYSYSGEIQFTENSISGICAFQLSRFINKALQNKTLKNGINIYLDLFNNLTKSDIIEMLRHRKKSFGKLCIEDLFTGLLNKRLGQVILKESEALPLTRTINSLTNAEIELIAELCKGLKFCCNDASAFNNSQVTCGGIDKSEINFNTMSSKKHKNLYYAGEIVDVDGLCGGYNLHWCWVSGIIVGESIAKRLGGVNDKNN